MSMASSKKVENVDLRPEEEKFLQANLGNRGKQELKAVVRIFFGGRYALENFSPLQSNSWGARMKIRFSIARTSVPQRQSTSRIASEAPILLMLLLQRCAFQLPEVPLPCY